MNDTPRKIVRNTITNSISFLFLFITSFFLVPFIIHSLGTQMYGGVWTIIGALTAYIGLLDLGTGTAFVKYISEYYTKGMMDDLLQVVNTGIIAYAVIGSLIIGLVFVFGDSLLSLVGVPQEIFSDAEFVLHAAVCIFVMTGIASPVTSIINGIQRMEINLYVSLVTQTLTVVGTIFVLQSGYGVRGLIINNFVVAAVNIFSSRVIASKLIPSLKFHPRYFVFAKVKQFLGYGFNLQVSRIGQIILFQTDRIFSLRFFGTLVSTHYDVSARLTSATRSSSSVILTALIPAISEIDAKKDREQLLSLYKRGTKYIAIVASFFFAFVAVFTSDILFAWLGHGFEASIIFVRLLAIGYFFNIVTGIASSMTAGLGKTELDRNYGVLVAVVNICAILLGALLFGPIGIAVGTSLSLIVGACYVFLAFHKIINISTLQIARIFLKPISICTAAALITQIVIHTIYPMSFSREGTIVSLLLAMILYLGIVVVTLLSSKVFDGYDISIVRSIVRRVIASFQN
jgi:O-antigen/teichoic acid export membrane protein